MYAEPVLTLNVYEDVFVTLTAGIETGNRAGSVRQLIDYLYTGYVMWGVDVDLYNTAKCRIVSFDFSVVDINYLKGVDDV